MSLVNFCANDHIVSPSSSLSMGKLISLCSVHGSLTFNSYWENISDKDFASESMRVQFLSQFKFKSYFLTKLTASDTRTKGHQDYFVGKKATWRVTAQTGE